MDRHDTLAVVCHADWLGHTWVGLGNFCPSHRWPLDSHRRNPDLETPRPGNLQTTEKEGFFHSDPSFLPFLTENVSELSMTRSQCTPA